MAHHQIQRLFQQGARQGVLTDLTQCLDEYIVDVGPYRTAPHRLWVVVRVVARYRGDNVLSPKLVRVCEMGDQSGADGFGQLASPQGIEVKRRDHGDRLIIVQGAEQARLLVPIVFDHPAHDGCGATAPHGPLGVHPQRFGHHRQRTHLHAEVGVQVRRFDRHPVIPQRAVVQARRVGVVVLGQTVGVVVVHAEPPGVPAHQWHIDLL